MNSKLENLIHELGAKHGVLEYLRDISDLKDLIVPNIILSKNEQYSTGAEAKLRALCSKYNTEDVIVRTSEKSDWSCMVDTMPTLTCSLDEVSRFIETAREKCQAPSLLEYARIAKNEYKPDAVTISLAPKFESAQFTLTEHPNQRDTLLLDVRDNYEFSGILTDSIDILNNSITEKQVSDCKMETFSRLSQAELLANINLRDKMRETGSFDESDALQFEHIKHPDGNQPYLLTQVRQLAKRKFADFSLNSIFSSNRIFGISENTNHVLPIIKEAFRKLVFIQGDKLNAPYAALPVSVSADLKNNEICQNMLSYIAGPSAGSQALSHNNTRFVQAALRKGGLAILDSLAARLLLNKKQLKFTTDGMNYNIE